MIVASLILRPSPPDQILRCTNNEATIQTSPLDVSITPSIPYISLPSAPCLVASALAPSTDPNRY